VDAAGAVRVRAVQSVTNVAAGARTLTLLFNLKDFSDAGVQGALHIEKLQLFQDRPTGIAWLDSFSGEPYAFGGDPAQTYTLSVTDGTGAGNYVYGQIVDVSVGQAPTGKTFRGWIGDTDHLASATAATTTITMPSHAVSITANFEISTYTVTFDLAGKGSRSGGGELSQTVNHGTAATAPTVTANTGWTFTGWDKAFNNITAVTTVTALYSQITYPVTFDLAGKGTRTDGGELSQTINHGAAASVPTVTANTGWTFTGWDVAFGNITSNLTVTAQYSIVTYTVTFDLAGKGTRSGGGALSQTVNHGEAATAPTVTANSGWTFTGWDKTFSSITSNLTVTAQYSASVVPHTVTFVEGANGTITGTKIQTVNHGTSCEQVTAEPNTGYNFVNWTGTNGFVTTISNPLTVTNVTSDMMITANFLADIESDFQYTDNGSDITITKYIGLGGALVIPPTLGIDGKPVISIGDEAFKDCTGLTSVTIPDSVTSIGVSAFRGCTSLASVTIGNGVAGIGNSAFYNCTGLTGIIIPKNVASIGYQVFYNCAGMTAITVDPENSKYSSVNGVLFNYGKDTLIVCPKGKTGSFTIPGTVTSIGGGAFNSCAGLTSVTIPDNVGSIGDFAFYGCSGLTSIHIPTNIATIGDSVFGRCSGLTNVTIPANVTSIVCYAFWNCGSLTSTTFLGNAPSMGSEAFSGCAANFTVYYIYGALRFTEPTWEGYPSAILSYTVTFDLAGKGSRSGGGALSQTVNHGAAATAPTVTANSGWTFTGWNKTFNNITEITSVTAQYSAVIPPPPPPVTTYTVTFDLAGKGTRTGGGALSQTVNSGGSATAPTVSASSGWTFTGWNKTFNNITVNTSVTAQYSQVTPPPPPPPPPVTTYTVTFDLAGKGTRTGGGALSQTVNSGGSATAPTVTANAGWTFSGWNKTFSNVTSNLTVTANFAINSVTILTDVDTINIPEGATNTFQVKLSAQPTASRTVSVSRFSGDGDITVSSGSSLTFTTTNWGTYQTVTLAAAEDADASNGTAVIRCSTAGLADKDVTANEVDNDTTLTVSNDGNGTTTPTGATVVTKSAATAISATDNVGYRFVNWTATSGSATFADANSANTSVTISAPATIRANFAINSVAILTDLDTINVPEGLTNTFQVKLSAQPTASKTVTVARFSGDSDITVSTGASLTFTTSNWGTYQTVTLAAAQDADTANGTAIIRCASPGMSNKDVTATEVDDDTTLTVTNDGNGTNTPSGATVVTKSAATSINATASNSYHFVNWTATNGSASFGNANTASTTAAITAPAIIRANFAINAYTLTYAAAANGKITGTASQTVNHGANGTVVTAVADTGYHFTGWSDAVATASRTDTGVTVDISVTANFAINSVAILTDFDTINILEGLTNTFQVKLSAQPTASKTVTVFRFSGDSDITVSVGAALTFTTSDWGNYQTVILAAAEDADAENGSTEIRCSSTGLADKNVTATEVENDTTLTVSNDGNGTTTPYGATVVTKSAATSISATPSSGYHFVNWTATSGSAIFGNANGASTSAAITVPATIRANFAINPVAILTDLDTINIPEGATNTVQVRLSAQPTGDKTVTVARFSGDVDLAVLSGAILTFTTSNWDTYQTVTLAAAEDADTANGTAVIRCSSDGLTDKDVADTELDNDYTLTVSNDGNGTTLPSGASVQTKGSDVGINATSSTGYHFANWAVTDGSATFADANSANTTTSASADVAIRANFAINTYIVTFDLAGKGTSAGDSELSQTINHGAAAAAPTITANPSWTFNGWNNTYNNIISNRTVTAQWIPGPPMIADPGTKNAMVGVQFTLALSVESESSPVNSVTVAGLPVGLKFDSKTKVITGVPTAVGNKTVTVTAKNTFKTPEVQTFSIAVDALSSWAQGTFNGYCVLNDDPGMATMTVTALGSVTGKLSAGGKNYTLSAASYARRDEDGAFWVSDTISVDSEDLPLTFKVTNPALAELPTLSVAEGWFAGEPAGEPAVKMYRNVWKDTGAAAILEPFIGYYTAVMPGGTDYGSGYLAITVDKAGVVKTTGKLADGTALSLSGTLIFRNEPACLFTVIYTSPAAYKGAGLFGLAEFVKPEGDDHVFLRTLDGVPFIWENRNPQAATEYGKGFDRELGLSGGWYDKTGNLYAYYQGKALSAAVDTGAADLELTVAGTRYTSTCWNFSDMALTPVLKSGAMTGLSVVPKAGLPVNLGGNSWNYDAENTEALTMGLTRATGIFKGSFKAWFDYVKTHTSKSISYEGVLTPEREDKTDGAAGRGFFLWSDPSPGYPFKLSYDFIIQTGQ
jgi:hypothetical protein